MLVSLIGCSMKQGTKLQPEKVDLLEPVNIQMNTEKAAYRNLYNAKVYSATVVPVTEEYAFEYSTNIEEILYYPGTKVEKDDILVISNSEKLDKDIKSLEEKIADMDDGMKQYKAIYEESQEISSEEVKQLKKIIEDFEINEPEIYLTTDTADSTSQVNPEYSQWRQEYEACIGEYEMAMLNMTVADAELEQKTRLYELDRDYIMTQLEGLKEEKSKYQIEAGIDGEIVAISQMYYDQKAVAAGRPVIAVGNTDELIIKCDYINKATVSAAKEIYSFIDGVRYDVTYQPIDTAEYERLDAKGEKIYSTFTIEGEYKNIQTGDFAVIVLVNDSRERVLTIPKGAIHKESGISFVYKSVDGRNVQTMIHTGMSDGVYTEVTDGLSEGDMVVLSEAVVHGSKTAAVEYGSFYNKFEEAGYMYYPITETVYPPITYGTIYFEEYLVAEYQHVNKGDPIATIRVVADEIELKRLEVQIRRLKERLKDLVNSETDVSDEVLSAKRKEITEAEDKREKMLSDAKVTTVTATSTGVIVSLGNYNPNDIVLGSYSIAIIADESNCYVVVEDENRLLSYGNDVLITYQNKDNVEDTSYGVVANLSQVGITGELRTPSTLIRLNPDDIVDMAVTNTDRNNWWNPNRYNVSANIRETENVLVVPKKAVTEIAGCTYVDVIDQEGQVVSYSFIAGGYDSSYYWVIDGLMEGMKVCLE
jgi:HlyD family secretion protein